MGSLKHCCNCKLLSTLYKKFQQRNMKLLIVLALCVVYIACSHVEHKTDDDLFQEDVKREAKQKAQKAIRGQKDCASWGMVDDWEHCCILRSGTTQWCIRWGCKSWKYDCDGKMKGFCKPNCYRA